MPKPKHNAPKRPRLTRRGFLRASAVGAGVIAAPTLWIPRMSRATPAFGQVKHLIVINLDGGMRSTCLFNADVSEQWNPPAISGIQAGAAGTEWGVGGVFSPSAHDGGVLGPVPSIPMISDQICVLGTVDHTPGADRGDGTHDTAKLRMATGAPDGQVGLLTRIYRDHALYQGGGIDTNLPPVAINDARLFGVGSGEWGPFRPVYVNSHRDFRSGGGDLGLEAPVWALAYGAGADEAYRRQRSARHRSLVEGLVDSKRQARTFRPIFTDPLLAVRDEPDAAAHGMSNAELMAALGDSDFGADVALALRFCGFGSPAVAIGDGGWDFHSDELFEFNELATTFDRVLSGLAFALQRLQHPDGGTYWDHSLVVCVSEFGRDNTELNGFNSGNGSDHNGGAASRYQALPFMGGVVGQGGKFFGATDRNTMEPKSGEPVFGSLSLLSMCLDVLGIDFEPHFPDAPLDAIF